MHYLRPVNFIFNAMLLAITTVSFVSAAEEVDFSSEESILWGEEQTVYTATKSITQLKRAPAVATVVTAQQIDNMGARTLLDVIKQVPGMGVSVDTANGVVNVEVRGAKVNYSTNVLVLIDGHSVNDVYYGSAINYFDYPVGLIKRLEIIRSPGSALYGTGAFGAVINIITKDDFVTDSTELRLSTGNNNRAQGSVLLNQKFQDLNVRGYLNYVSEDSHDLYVAKDARGQTGNTLDDFARYDLNLQFDYHDFSANFSYMRNKQGPYIGVAGVLNDETTQDTNNSYIDLRYKKWFNEDLQVNVKVYQDRKLYQTDWEIFPAQANPIPNFGGSMYGRPHGEMHTTGTELQADYALSSTNLLTVGASYEVKDGANATHVTNFNPLNFQPLGSMQDISDWGNFTKLATQYISALYAQNIWHMTPQLSWTVGARYDHYSNFGDTVNPRLAMVWDQSEATSIKLLYGTAFRAPSFAELYIINNPSLLGNEDLKPEKNATYELSINHDFSRQITAELNFFRSRITDFIIQVPTGFGAQAKYMNQGGLDIDGVEVEVRTKMDINNYGYVNFTYQNPKDSETGDLHYGISRHKANAGLNMEISPQVNFNTNINASGNRSRKTNDRLNRDEMAKYVLVDASLIFKGYFTSTEFQVTAHNLFDKNYYTPDETAAIPGDYPMNGRTVVAGVKVSL